MQALAKELQSIANRMAKVPSSNRGRRANKNKTPNSLGASTSVVQPSLTINQGKRRRTRKRRQNGSALSVSTGDVLVTKVELVKTIKIEANKSSASDHIDIIPDSFPWLKNFFGSFDRIKFESLKFFWKPMVGTVYGGAVSMGVDWDWAVSDGDRAKISGFSPNISLPIYADGENRPLVLVKNRLQSRLWYLPRSSEWNDKGPGKVVYCVDGKSDKSEQTVGDIWVRYTVVLSGTNPA